MLDTIEKIADWLESVFKKLQLKNLILVGHSQGCLEILEYSSRYKERLKKLVFVGGSNKMPVHPDLIELAQSGHSDAVKLMMKWGYEGSKKFIGGNPVEKIIQSPRDISEILAVDLNACNNYSNGSEAAKVIENVQRDINIALVNELARIFPALDVDVEDVLSAAATKWNFHRYTPGVGVGGHCIPVDPYYMIQRAADVGVPAGLITAARAVNRSMPSHVAGVLGDLMWNAGVPAGEAKVLLLGWSYLSLIHI